MMKTTWKFRHLSRLFTALLPALLFLGCGDDDGGVVDADAITFVNQGWDKYSAGDFVAAEAKFNSAISNSSNTGGGYNGMGWVLLATMELDSSGDPTRSISLQTDSTLAAALQYFDRAVAEGFPDADAQAGRTIIFNLANEFRQAVNAGLDAVAIDLSFQLPGDASVDIRDVRLAMAQSYLELGEYEEALEQAVLINPNLDPINLNSETFLSQLIARLQVLADDLG